MAKKKSTAFTLAETLITLMVIGVVAVLTIPSLMQQINEYVLGKQRTVFEKKFAEGLRQMRVDEKLAEKYAATADFVTEMGKYFKISAICDKDNLKNCFSDTFTARAILNGKENASKSFTTSDIKTTKNLVEKSSYDTDVLGVVFSDGVRMLITYDTECIGIGSGNTTGNLYSCFGYIADVNGNKAPNSSAKDIVSNLALINNFGLSFEIMDNKIYSANSCDDNDVCYTAINGNYFKGAQEFCSQKGGKIASVAQLNEMAKAVYDNNPKCTKSTYYGQPWYYGGDSSITFAHPIWTALNGSSQNLFVIWTDDAYNRSFCPDGSGRSNYGTSNSNQYVLCVK